MATSFSLVGNENKNASVLYNYPEKPINKSETSSSPINITSSMIENLNVTKDGSTISYTANSLYIYKNTNFVIEGVTDVDNSIEGEIVIEHTPINNNNVNTVYSVFFLTLSNSNNDIDDLISMIDNTNPTKNSVTINLNSYIPTQTNGCISYINNILHKEYYIFCVPLLISKNLNGNFFNQNPHTTTINYSLSNYKFIPFNSLSNQTANTDQIYIDCNPTGESDETIRTYNLPINSSLMGDIQKNELIKMILNFCLFSTGIICAYFGVPILNSYIVAIEFKNNEKYLGFLPLSSRVTGNNFVIVYFGLFIFLMTVFLLMMGFAIQNYVMSGVGLLFFILFAFASALLNQPEHTKEYLSKKGLLKPLEFTGSMSIMNGITAFVIGVSIIVLLSMYLTGTMESGPDNPFKTATNEFIFLIIFLILFIAPFVSFSYAVMATKKKTQ
jgi:hypothetical protein